MEDNKNFHAQSKSMAQRKGHIVDLTQEMETSPGAGGAKIIDLTNVLQPASQPAPESSDAAQNSSFQPKLTVHNRMVSEPVAPRTQSASDIKRPVSAPLEADSFALTDDDIAADSAIPAKAGQSPALAQAAPKDAADTLEPELSLYSESAAAEPHAASEQAEVSGEMVLEDDAIDLDGLFETDEAAPEDLLELTDDALPAAPPAAADTAPAIPVDAEGPTLESADAMEVAEAPAPQAAFPAAPVSEEEEDVIELTDIVTPTELTEACHAAEAADAAGLCEDEEEVIELTDIVDPAELADACNAADAAGVCADDEEVIELTDIVDPAELADARMASAVAAIYQDEEGAIELTDIVDPAAPATAALDHAPMEAQQEEDFFDLADALDDDESDAARDASADQADDEPVLELTDIVDAFDAAADMAAADVLEAQAETAPGTQESEAKAAETVDGLEALRIKGEVTFEDDFLADDDLLAPEAEKEPEDDEQVIHLDRVLGRIMQKDDQRAELVSTADEDMDLAIDLKEIQDGIESPVRLSQQAVAQAVEQFIRSRYADTIEKMIASAVEKVVTREMENIKRSLLEDQEPEA